MSLKPDYIVKNFRDWLIKESGLSWEQSLKDWTSNIKEYFGKFGEKEGYEPIFTKKDVKEYLVDIVWRIKGPQRSLCLAMESELSKNEKNILEDFGKLVDVKALIKVGLFHLRSTITEVKIVEKMKDILTAQWIVWPREIYLIIFMKYDNDRGEIIINAYDLDFKGATHRKIYGDAFPFSKS